MSSATTSPTRPQALIDGLCDRLPKCTRAQAQLSRLVLSPRLRQALARAFDVPALSAHVGGSLEGTTIDLECRYGRLRVCIDSSTLPALSMAFALPNPRTSQAVVQTLLEPVFNAVAGLLPELRVLSSAPTSQPQPTLTRLRLDELEAALIECDAAVIEHLLCSLPCEPELGANLNLRLPGHVRLIHRYWALAVLQSLRAGDVVLLDPVEPEASSRHFPLWFGIGNTWRGQVELHLQELTMQISDTPHFSPSDDDPPTDLSASSLGKLQVPVSFELDTARLSLTELAELQPGHTVELNSPVLNAVVRLCCHGQSIGTGQLVAIGDQLGVRITRMELQAHHEVEAALDYAASPAAASGPGGELEGHDPGQTPFGAFNGSFEELT